MRQVFCTCPEKDAEAVATALLEERLVACVQAFGVRSRYWWRGKLETEEEVMLLMKTRAELIERLIERIGQLHPYEVPEVVSVAICEGNPAYLGWLKAETAS